MEAKNLCETCDAETDDIECTDCLNTRAARFLAGPKITAVIPPRRRWNRVLKKHTVESVASVTLSCGHTTTIHPAHAVIGGESNCSDCFLDEMATISGI